MKECDISKVQVLLDLFAVSPEKRDDEWRNQFYANVGDASFRCETPQIIAGPDGFPYFSLLSPEPHVGFESFCVCNLVEVATREGFGIVINRRTDGADWVFSYGDLVMFRLTGSFHVPSTSSSPPQKVLTSPGEKVLLGTPSEAYLPCYVRAIIRRFMQQTLNVENPGVFLMVRASDPVPNQLVFSFFREDYGSDEEYFNVMRWFSWFLPRNYQVIGVPKDSDLCQNFVPL